MVKVRNKIKFIYLLRICGLTAAIFAHGRVYQHWRLEIFIETGGFASPSRTIAPSALSACVDVEAATAKTEATCCYAKQCYYDVSVAMTSAIRTGITAILIVVRIFIERDLTNTEKFHIG